VRCSRTASRPPDAQPSAPHALRPGADPIGTLRGWVRASHHVTSNARWSQQHFQRVIHTGVRREPTSRARRFAPGETESEHEGRVGRTGLGRNIGRARHFGSLPDLPFEVWRHRLVGVACLAHVEHCGLRRREVAVRIVRETTGCIGRSSCCRCRARCEAIDAHATQDPPRCGGEPTGAPRPPVRVPEIGPHGTGSAHRWDAGAVGCDQAEPPRRPTRPLMPA